MVTKNKKSTTAKKCRMCLNELALERNFHKSYSQFDADGYQSICKNCLSSYIEENKENIKEVKHLLQIVDKPFKIEVWQKAYDSDKDTLGEYFRIINLNYKNETFLNSDPDKQVSNIDLSFDNVKKELDINQEDINELMKFWGRGFDIDSYIWLQNEFEDFLNRYECDSKGMELLIKQICLTELDIEIRRENNEKVDQQLKTLQDLLGSSNLKPVQETGANALDQESFGTLIKKYENERPIPEPEESWEDVDGIKRYINVWFLGHLCKMLGIENTYSQLYDQEIRKYTVESPSENYVGGDE